MVRLAGRFGRYGYRRITKMLETEGWRVNHKRVERIWRQEGLKVPKKQPPAFVAGVGQIVGRHTSQPRRLTFAPVALS